MFDALYGTDAVSEDAGAARSSEYNPVCSLLYFILMFFYVFFSRSRRHPLPLAGGEHFLKIKFQQKVLATRSSEYIPVRSLVYLLYSIFFFLVVGFFSCKFEAPPLVLNAAHVYN